MILSALLDQLEQSENITKVIDFIQSLASENYGRSRNFDREFKILLLKFSGGKNLVERDRKLKSLSDNLEKAVNVSF